MVIPGRHHFYDNLSKIQDDLKCQTDEEGKNFWSFDAGEDSAEEDPVEEDSADADPADESVDTTAPGGES